MSTVGTDLLERLLRECARHRPTPVFPAEFAHTAGFGREPVEAAFDHLRTLKLVFLTDWIQGHGRGFIITEIGVEVLNNPDLLDELRLQPVSPQPGVLSAPPQGRPDPGEEPPHHDPTAPEDQPAAEDRAAAVTRALVRPPRPLVTYLFILAILGVFLAGLNMAIERNVKPLSRYLGLKVDLEVAKIIHDTGAMLPNDVVIHEQWWRLWSYAFVQGWGLLGLLLGMWYLYSIGVPAENMWGYWRFFGLFFCSVLGGSSAALFWDSYALGIFAADCGLMAGQIVWLIGNHAYLPKEAHGLKRGLMSNVLFIVMISALLLSMVPEYSPAIPLGGGLTGAVFAFFCLWNRYHPGALRWVGLAGMIALPLVILGVVANSFDTIKENQQQRMAALQKVAEDAARAKEKERREAAERDLHGKALNAARRVFDHRAVVILSGDKKGKEFADREFIHDAIIEFTSASNDLKKGIDYLKNERPLGKKTDKAIAVDLAFLELFQSFLEALKEERSFPERRADLRDKAFAAKKLLEDFEAGR